MANVHFLCTALIKRALILVTNPTSHHGPGTPLLHSTLNPDTGEPQSSSEIPDLDVENTQLEIIELQPTINQSDPNVRTGVSRHWLSLFLIHGVQQATVHQWVF